MERYFLEPYRFIAPFRSTFWVRLSRGMILRNLRKKQTIVRFSCSGKEHLRASLDAKAGILLTPNHSRWPDPMVVGTVLSQQFDEYPYYVASYHVRLPERFRSHAAAANWTIDPASMNPDELDWDAFDAIQESALVHQALDCKRV